MVFELEGGKALLDIQDVAEESGDLDHRGNVFDFYFIRQCCPFMQTFVG